MTQKRQVLFTVIVCALGYFVDIYDLVLFGIVRVPSLRAIGVPDDQLLDTGVLLLNMQMAGMLVGGLVWGILGDKRGRLSVLFGSILMYSLANIANAYVESVPMYAGLRFIAGVGLAGELGAAITLVSEIMSKETRGIGTTIVASVGVSGAVLAGIIGETQTWQTAYWIGGILGLLLLLLRIGVLESGMFKNVSSQGHVQRGNFFMLFQNKERFFRYLNSILIGIPIWYVIGVLVTFAPELTRAIEVTGPVTGAKSILFCYIGLIVGDLFSGLLSQKLRSRKKSVFVFIGMTGVGIVYYVLCRGLTPEQFYALCVFLGTGVGYWAVFVTIASEQFGTNIRSTVTTTVPNFVRGSVVPITLSFQFLKPSLGLIYSALVVGVVCLVLALGALSRLKESYGRDLDFLEPS